MTSFARAPLVAVLGPTNTGKTHLAVERMCGHSSGMIGFPLRLLAREIYDRVVALKGPRQVALITGEERIEPPGARWWLCTAESMPSDRDAAFVAIDEAQLGADPERGHVFTERLLHFRGREETMILGSDTLRPMLRALTPEAEIVSRPRFSTLSYAGAGKLSRLPPRSAVVAFSAEEVYAVAETLRRLRGGAAVVMGALSPRTRNAQVAMFQAGEVNYLVATDAIGMGLNMDVAHVAFASLVKFDGKRRRRLSVAEMAQIAGRAGRHQRDGSFGTLGLAGDRVAFDPREIEAIEEHRFPALESLYWRKGDPSVESVDALIADLEAKPDDPVLRAAPEAVDLAVLKKLAEEAWVRERARDPAMVARLWAACGLPDFRKTGVEPHSRLVGRLFRHLSEGDGHIPGPTFAQEIANLDQLQGDVETLAARLAAIRTWAYVAHRADWLADPAHWAARTRAIEERLSDALHDRLTQRFVDRRTTALLRDIGAKGEDVLPVRVDGEGWVHVGGQEIGRLSGFRFIVDPDARHADKKRLLAAAERRLGGEYSRRAAGLIADEDSAFMLATDAGLPVAIFWKGEVVARLTRGRSLTSPGMVLHKSLDPLGAKTREMVMGRLETWFGKTMAGAIGALLKIEAAAGDAGTLPQVRAVLAPLADAGGVIAREKIGPALTALDKGRRNRIAQLDVTIGALDLYHPKLLRPEAIRWRAALAAVQRGEPMPALPPESAVLVETPEDCAIADVWRAAGYRPLGRHMLRADLAERLGRAAHDAREGRRPFALDPALATSLGLDEEARERLMRALGFRRAEDEQWIWRGRQERAPAPTHTGSGHFAELAGLVAK